MLKLNEVLPVFVANGAEPVGSVATFDVAVFSAGFTHSGFAAPTKGTPIHNPTKFGPTPTTRSDIVVIVLSYKNTTTIPKTLTNFGRIRT